MGKLDWARAHGALLGCLLAGISLSAACSSGSGGGAATGNDAGACAHDGAVGGSGSSSGAINALACHDYHPGANMLSGTFTGNASINSQFAAFAQACGDLQTVAEDSVFDVTAACQAIALDLGDTSSPADKQGTDLMSFWCSEATTQIKAALSASGGTTPNISFEPQLCSAAVSVAGSCQAICSPGGTCDIAASPPTCAGGALVVSCLGSCTGMAGASIDCTGSCGGNCSGSCAATAGVAVDCEGKCDGTCLAKAGVGNGMGVQADGTCQGACSGTCTYSASAPTQQCAGECTGKCDATCSAMGGTPAECSGACSAVAMPLWCKGGTPKGGCSVDPNCQANCDASATAKAQCPQSVVTVIASGPSTPQFDVLVNTLETNLPSLLLVAEERGMAFANLIQQVTSSGASTFSASLDAEGAACLVQIVPDITQAGTDFPLAVSSALSVLGSVGIQ